jgi:hypothetical protein
MLASVPASMLNQNTSDLGIPNRIDPKTSRFRRLKRTRQAIYARLQHLYRKRFPN